MNKLLSWFSNILHSPKIELTGGIMKKFLIAILATFPLLAFDASQHIVPDTEKNHEKYPNDKFPLNNGSNSTSPTTPTSSAYTAPSTNVTSPTTSTLPSSNMTTPSTNTAPSTTVSPGRTTSPGTSTLPSTPIRR